MEQNYRNQHCVNENWPLTPYVYGIFHFGSIENLFISCYGLSLNQNLEEKL